MEQTLRRQVPAKVNLYLSITGRRPDGYHTIETVFWPLHGLTDTITIRLTSGNGVQLEIHPSHFHIPTDQRNTCVRAATIFTSEIGVASHISIVLEKRIPPAAGLGGGSADAAAVLHLLNELFSQPLPVSRLRAIAKKVGADVPFFLDPRPAFAQGIGDELRYLTPPPSQLPLVVFWPRFPVRAAWAYQRYDELVERHGTPYLPPVAPETFLETLRTGTLRGIAAGTFNALEEALIRKFPLLPILQRGMSAAGALCVHVSGSGPSMFALFPTARKAVAAAQTVEREFSGAVRCLFAGTAAATSEHIFSTP